MTDISFAPTRPSVSELPLRGYRLTWSPDAPLAVSSPEHWLLSRKGVSLVELFTAEEQRARTSQAYYRSAVGERLRVVDIEECNGAVTVVQRDETTGLEVCSTLSAPEGTRALRVETVVRNGSDTVVVLTAAASAVLGFGTDEASLGRMTLFDARSDWLAENRWSMRPLTDVLPRVAQAVHGQDSRGRAGITSHGAWSTGERLPVGIITGGGEALAWQIESSAGWHADLSQTERGGVLSLLGPTDLEHQFAHHLAPGGEFALVPAAIAAVTGGPDEALAELTAYRRTLRARSNRLPVVYNDFMNTTMGQPTTSVLLSLVREAYAAGAEVFCIDAGWFASPTIGDWWSTVGAWHEAADRFPDGGLKRVTDEIHARGMQVGLWFEPEVVGADGPAATALPEEAYFRRFGRRVREHDRFHLDFRHPAARAHVDLAIDAAVEAYGVSYLKLDYNINPGAGTSHAAAAPGDGLLGHVRAYRGWLDSLTDRYPGLLIENCSSGAMRADYGLLPSAHLQSTSDQQDALLYPPIAASAPASILPEQCANWAYPSDDMTDEETAFTLVTGLSGRLYLSGFLDRLRPWQTRAVADAVELHKSLRPELSDAVPFWPLGLPSWEDAHVCLGLRTERHTLLFVWDRADEASDIVVPGVTGSVTQAFLTSGWAVAPQADGVRLRTLPGPTARVLIVEEGR